MSAKIARPESRKSSPESGALAKAKVEKQGPSAELRNAAKAGLASLGIPDPAHLTPRGRQKAFALNFAAMINRLLALQEAHEKKGPGRKRADVLELAAECIMALGNALVMAKALTPKGSFGEALPARGRFTGQFPWPLYILINELSEVHAGKQSPLFSKNCADPEPRLQQHNHLHVSMKVTAAAVLTALNENGVGLDAAARKIAEIFQRCGIQSPHKTKRPGESFSVGTIIDWRKDYAKSSKLYQAQLETHRHLAANLKDEGWVEAAVQHQLLEVFDSMIRNVIYQP